jgi:hypothetical protein
LPEAPGLSLVEGRPPSGSGRQRQRGQPAFHEAAVDDDPQAGGVEIR